MRPCQLTRRGRPGRQPLHNVPPGAITNGMQQKVHPLMVKHVLKYEASVSNGQAVTEALTRRRGVEGQRQQDGGFDPDAAHGDAEAAPDRLLTREEGPAVAKGN